MFINNDISLRLIQWKSWWFFWWKYDTKMKRKNEFGGFVGHKNVVLIGVVLKRENDM